MLALLLSLRDAAKRIPGYNVMQFSNSCFFQYCLRILHPFAISHQQYSGDPPSALLVLLVLGMALSVVNYPAATRRSRAF